MAFSPPSAQLRQAGNLTAPAGGHQAAARIHHTQVSGTLIGFWTPPFVPGAIGVPGFHLHFLRRPPRADMLTLRSARSITPDRRASPSTSRPLSAFPSWSKTSRARFATPKANVDRAGTSPTRNRPRHVLDGRAPSPAWCNRYCERRQSGGMADTPDLNPEPG